MPPEGQNVIAELADGSHVLAYWSDGLWWVGVEGSPDDAPVDQQVIGWHWPEA